MRQYNRGHHYSLNEVSKTHTNGDTGCTILTNEPFFSADRGHGQYTHKLLYLGRYAPFCHCSSHHSHVHPYVAATLPKHYFFVHEKSWNTFPHFHTECTHESLSGFSITIDSMHLEADCNADNVFELAEQELAERQVIYIDIAKQLPQDQVDFSEFKSIATRRGPLVGEWWKTEPHVMCCYKLARINFRYFGVQSRLEAVLLVKQQMLITCFNKEVWRLIDQWHPLTIEEIKALEATLAAELEEKQRTLGMVFGTSSAESISSKSK